MVSVELLRERLSDLSPSTSFAGITRTDLTVMLSNGSKVDEALLKALLKPVEPAKATFAETTAKFLRTSGYRTGGYTGTTGGLAGKVHEGLLYGYKPRPYSQGLRVGPEGTALPFRKTFGEKN